MTSRFRTVVSWNLDSWSSGSEIICPGVEANGFRSNHEAMLPSLGLSYQVKYERHSCFRAMKSLKGWKILGELMHVWIGFNATSCLDSTILPQPYECSFPVVSGPKE
jgi:hypothetical protein